MWTNVLKPAGKFVAAGAFITAKATIKALDYTSAAVGAIAATPLCIAYGIATLPLNPGVAGLTKYQISKGMVSAGETTPFEFFKNSLFRKTRNLVDAVSSKGLEPFKASSLAQRLTALAQRLTAA